MIFAVGQKASSISEFQAVWEHGKLKDKEDTSEFVITNWDKKKEKGND